MKQFDFSIPVSAGSEFICQIRISGTYEKKDASYTIDIASVYHSLYKNQESWTLIPHTFYTWIETLYGTDKIGELCLGHVMAIDGLHQDHIIQTKKELS